MEPKLPAIALPALELKVGEVGPCMAKISAVRQRLVLARMNYPHATYAEIGRMAGYEAKDDSSVRVSVWRAFQDEDVLYALKELAEQSVKESIGLAVSNLTLILSDPHHKNFWDATKYELGLRGISPEHVSRVVHELDVKGMSRDEMVKEIAEIMGRLKGAGIGVDIPALADYSVTDAEFEPVEDIFNEQI